MIRKLNSIKVQTELIKRGVLIFSPLEFRRIFDVEESTAGFFIKYHLKSGLFFKFKNGLYGLKSRSPSEFEIANRLYRPSYVSFEYALSFYNVIPESVYTVASATTRSTREFVIDNVSYPYHRIKKGAFTGYVKKYFNGQMALIASPEKALADYLYFVALGKKSFNDRLELGEINKKKLIEYAKLFKRPNLFEVIDQTYDKVRRNKNIIY